VKYTQQLTIKLDTSLKNHIKQQNRLSAEDTEIKLAEFHSKLDNVENQL